MSGKLMSDRELGKQWTGGSLKASLSLPYLLTDTDTADRESQYGDAE